jgi:hypothetical protein
MMPWLNLLKAAAATAAAMDAVAVQLFQRGSQHGSLFCERDSFPVILYSFSYSWKHNRQNFQTKCYVNLLNETDYGGACMEIWLAPTK